MSRVRQDSSSIAAWGAIFIGTLTGIATAGVPLFHAMTGLGPKVLPIGAQCGIIISCVTVTLAYTFTRLERSQVQIDELLSRAGSGVVVYKNTTSFLEALTEATVGALKVSSINAAVPRGVLPAQDEYFRQTSRYWTSREAVGASLRSVAYVETKSKALWVVSRAYESRNSAATSFAVIKQQSLGESANLCFHLVSKGGVYRSFLYPAPDLTGSMEGVCIYGIETYEVLQDLFDRIWHSAVPLSSGKLFHKDGLEMLARLSPSVVRSDDYQAAMALAT
jgi:hypothetical protein